MAPVHLALSRQHLRHLWRLWHLWHLALSLWGARSVAPAEGRQLWLRECLILVRCPSVALNCRAPSPTRRSRPRTSPLCRSSRRSSSTRETCCRCGSAACKCWLCSGVAGAALPARAAVTWLRSIPLCAAWFCAPCRLVVPAGLSLAPPPPPLLAPAALPGQRPEAEEVCAHHPKQPGVPSDLRRQPHRAEASAVALLVRRRGVCGPRNSPSSPGHQPAQPSPLLTCRPPLNWLPHAACRPSSTARTRPSAWRRGTCSSSAQPPTSQRPRWCSTQVSWAAASCLAWCGAGPGHVHGHGPYERPGWC